MLVNYMSLLLAGTSTMSDADVLADDEVSVNERSAVDMLAGTSTKMSSHFSGLHLVEQKDPIWFCWRQPGERHC